MPTPQTELRYSNDVNRRLWLLNNGFEVLHEAVRIGCQRVYAMSSSITPSQNYELHYYDVNSPSNSFTLYETDTYPPDGYEGLFFCPRDRTPGPFGDFGFGTGETSERTFSLHAGRIAHNPEHGLRNVSQTKPPRMRRSTFREDWAFTAEHLFVEGQPTSQFTFWMTAVHLCGDNMGTHGLLRFLGLKPVTLDRLVELPSYRQLLGRLPGLKVEFEPFYEEELDSRTNRWRGVVSANIKTGWLSSERRKFLLD